MQNTNSTPNFEDIATHIELVDTTLPEPEEFKKLIITAVTQRMLLSILDTFTPEMKAEIEQIVASGVSEEEKFAKIQTVILKSPQTVEAAKKFIAEDMATQVAEISEGKFRWVMG